MTDTAEAQNSTQLEPGVLAEAPALIERVFPSQKISTETYRERKATHGQTLNALGSYWKGRKPLIMVRAIVLGSLLPATEDPEADLAVFEQLMGIDDAAFGRREPKLKAGDVAARITLENPWDFFDYTIQGEQVDPEEVTELAFPIYLADYPGLKIRWSRKIDPADKADLLAAAMRGLAYEEKVDLCKRPEELNPEWLYGPVWPAVNHHLAHLGVEAYSFEALAEQLGILRFGHRPRIGDTFCGGGSVPFEAARLGCDVYASDLNPVACMLTWGSLNIIGASPERRAEIEAKKQRVAEAVDREITELGIEHNERGDRAKAFLYCLETQCPQTGWVVPMAPSWVISKTQNVIARLHPDYEHKRFEIEIASGVSDAELKAAQQGTVQNEQLVYELDGHVYRTPIRTLRGDYRDSEGTTRNQLRQWDKHDFKPRPEDTFQERLYCIQWITAETVGISRPKTYFGSVTEADLERERKVERIVEENLAGWQEEGLVPEMPIEPGDKTDEPIRTRGWRYWHQLFSPRDLVLLSTYNKASSNDARLKTLFSKLPNYSSKLSQWLVNNYGQMPNHVFYNQALNVFYNYGSRGYSMTKNTFFVDVSFHVENKSNIIKCLDARDCKTDNDIWITDPPYADAISYHEITEFFIAWLRKNPPAPFDQWTWDSRRSLAVQGTGDDFRRSMVDA
ncbi:DUF1156 domain-containing protein, partial [Halorhodospira sp. 9621]|uniref:DUF1156 domain-containing protein n=1 Tax=Halorhodospira sp. 9621 TaxID=2899135 RepID=UPI001EE8CBEC